MSQPKHIDPVTQAVLGSRDLYTALHEPLEKGVQVALLAADLPHTADVNAVNFSTLNLLHHIAVAGAQQPAAALVNASTDNITAVMQSLH